MKKGLSIIICCYNSEARLPKTLEYLAKQEISKDIPVELIIVDNASSDHTKEIARKEWEKYKTHFLFRIIDEEKKGQMHARKKGVLESQYEYILFCDDDNWLQSNYLEIAFNLMESNERIGALGGQGIAVSDIDLPEWFSDFAWGFAAGKQAKESGDISKRGFIWGAGMTTRRYLLIKVFDDNYPFLMQGRTGSQLSSGDDTEICKRILLLRQLLYYDEALSFYHYMSPNRLTWAYKKKLCEGLDYAKITMRKYDVIFNEINRSALKRYLGILYNMLKLVKPSSSNMDIKTDLWAKIGLLLKSEKMVKDWEYKNIIKFALQK